MKNLITFFLLAFAGVVSGATNTDYANKPGYDANGYPITTPSTSSVDIVVDENGDPDSLRLDSLNHLDVVAHAHAEGGHILFTGNFTADGNIILIDLSNTTDYPHSNTTWIHTANIIMNIAGDASSSRYLIEIGWIEDINASNSHFHKIFAIEGTKQAGDHDIIITQNPEAPKLKATGFLGPAETVTAFDTGTTHLDSLDQTTGTVTPADGDMVMRVTNITGGVTVNIMVGYHSH